MKIRLSGRDKRYVEAMCSALGLSQSQFFAALIDHDRNDFMRMVETAPVPAGVS